MTLSSLHRDLLFEILVRIERPVDVLSVFACCRSFSALRDDVPLPAMWVLARTSSEVHEILNRAVDRDRQEQVQLVLSDSVRSKLDDRQLALALLSAIRLRRVVAMHMLLRFCRLSIPDAGQEELARIISKDDLVNSFQMCEIRVFGTERDDPAGVFRYMTINAFSVEDDGVSGSVSYFECRTPYDAAARHRVVGDGLTILVAAPTRLARASVRSVCTLNGRLIVSCTVGRSAERDC